MENFLDAIDRLQRGNLRGKVIVNISGEEAYEGSSGGAIYYNKSESKPLE